MRTILFLMLLITVTMNLLSQNRSVDRSPAVAGSFYPANKDSLTRELTTFFSTCVKTASDQRVRAIISPHAGYVFSGKVAASAFSAIPRNADYKNIFIIGSSHIMAFDGASVYNQGDFITPLGRMKVNLELILVRADRRVVQINDQRVIRPFQRHHIAPFDPLQVNRLQ